MLKTRIITGFIIAIIATLGIFYLPELLFTLLTALLILLAAWEWANLVGFSRDKYKMAYCGLMLCGLAIAYYTVPSTSIWIVGIGAVWWLLSLYLLTAYSNKKTWINNPYFKGIIGFFILVPCWVGMLVIRNQPHGAFYFFYLALLVSCADIGAYAVGRRFGKHKLVPTISPGKSWEGFYGGLATGTLLGIIVAIFWPHAHSWIILLIITWLAIVAGTLGDIIESIFKRLRGVKDSGNILPGHGGLLDRIDSLTAAVPIFALGLLVYLTY